MSKKNSNVILKDKFKNYQELSKIYINFKKQLNKLKKNFFLISSIFLISYFLFSFLGGERGLFSNLKKRDFFENLKKEEIELVVKIKNLEIKNSLLTDNLDLDYIDFLIRDKFLLGKKNETIYMIKNNEN